MKEGKKTRTKRERTRTTEAKEILIKNTKKEK